jgi:hypothetical protein
MDHRHRKAEAWPKAGSPSRGLAVVYVWTDEVDLAFETLILLAKTPFGALLYGSLKLDPTFDPLRKDPRFEKLLAESAPKD